MPRMTTQVAPPPDDGGDVELPLGVGCGCGGELVQVLVVGGDVCDGGDVLS